MRARGPLQLDRIGFKPVHESANRFTIGRQQQDKCECLLTVDTLSGWMTCCVASLPGQVGYAMKMLGEVGS